MDENLYIVNQPCPPSKNQALSAPRSRSRGTPENKVSFRPPTADEIARNELHSQLYLIDVATHLIEDINALKDEVQPMRDEIRFLINMESNFTETFRDNARKRQENKKARIDLSTQITELNLLSDELNHIHQQVRNTYSDYSKNQLMNNIDDESQIITQLEDDISYLSSELNFQKQNLQKIQNSKLKQQIQENDIKVTELNELLLSLRKEEKDKIEIHQSIFNKRPVLVASKSGIDKLKKKLEIVKYTHSKKKQEIIEQQAKYDYQKNQVKIIIDSKKREIQAQKRRREENKIYRANLFAERKRLLQEFEENEKKIEIEKKTKINKNDCNNNIKKIKVSQHPNSRLFNDDQANAKAKEIMQQNIQLLIDRDIIRKSQLIKVEPEEQEQPKRRFHHHRRKHRKHNHNDNEGDTYVFTTSDPRYGELRPLIGMVDNDNDNYNDNDDKDSNSLDKNERQYTSSSSGDQGSGNIKENEQLINKCTKLNNEMSENNINTIINVQSNNAQSSIGDTKINDQNKLSDINASPTHDDLNNKKSFHENENTRNDMPDQECFNNENNQIESSNINKESNHDQVSFDDKNAKSIQFQINDKDVSNKQVNSIDETTGIDQNKFSDEQISNDQVNPINNSTLGLQAKILDNINDADPINLNENNQESQADNKNRDDQTNINDKDTKIEQDHFNDNNDLSDSNTNNNQIIISDKKDNEQNNLNDNISNSDHNSIGNQNSLSDKNANSDHDRSSKDTEIDEDDFVSPSASSSDKTNQSDKSSSSDQSNLSEKSSRNYTNSESNQANFIEKSSKIDNISDNDTVNNREKSTDNKQKYLNVDIISDKEQDDLNIDKNNNNSQKPPFHKFLDIIHNDIANEASSNQIASTDQLSNINQHDLDGPEINSDQSDFVNQFVISDSASNEGENGDSGDKNSKTDINEANGITSTENNENSTPKSSISIGRNRFLKPNSLLKFLNLNPNIVNNPENNNPKTESNTSLDLGIRSSSKKKKKRSSFLFNREIKVEFNEEEDNDVENL